MARSALLITGVFLISIIVLVYGIPQASPAPTMITTATNSQPFSTVPVKAHNGQNLLPNIYDSQAINAQNVCPGYKALNIQTTSHGLTADLKLAGPACNVYGTDVNDLKLIVEHQAEDRLHVEITPSNVSPQNSSWYVLPEVLVSKPTIDEDYTSKAQGSDLEFIWSNDPTFSFTIRRYCNGDVIFSTKGTHLVFEDQFIEFGSALHENYNIYGLGEVIHGFRLGNNLTRTLYAADVGDPPDRNLYGDHPFYLETRYFEFSDTDGELRFVSNVTSVNSSYKSFSHGVYLRNAHGQEILLRPSNITWRTIGGNIDLYFYAGISQKQVITAHQVATVGLPAMQQYFAFGYHQCRWGYENWTVLQSVVDNFAKFSLPLDNIWLDIDYMNQYRDFENDQTRFGYAEGQDFLSKLHANNQHWIPIVDSAIYVPNPQNASDAYPTYDRGSSANSFMLNPDGSEYIGEVWPGYTVFPDWIGAALAGGGAFDWWTNEIAMWHHNIAFDGIWIDMSEVSSFCVGSCGSNYFEMKAIHPPFLLPGEPGDVVYSYPEEFKSTNASVAASTCTTLSAVTAAGLTSSSSTSYLRTTPTPGVRNINYPPYVINNVQGDLAVHAVSPNATHLDGSMEYDYHNLFGHQILNATYQALLKVFPTKRPFIIGRSTFAGSGKWAGHWGGDNASQFFYMMMSIPQALSFSLFGIPMFGVDTCGFDGNSDEELCNRWMQLSAFFPFYRNHNVLGATSQEPYIWASVAEATRTAAGIRYLLLPYIYTTFYLSHTTGSTTMRALSWEFPNDPTLASADRQFLLGSSLMITPVLTQGAKNVSGVFPGVGDGEVWYDWYNKSAVIAGPSENVTIPAPLGHIPVFIRGGRILPTQEPSLTTAASRKNHWGLLVALNREGMANGVLYVDDGESLVQIGTLLVKFLAKSQTLTATPAGTYIDTNPLANVTIMGVTSQPTAVSLSGIAIGRGWKYDNSSKVLTITGLKSATRSGAWSSPWSLSWS